MGIKKSTKAGLRILILMKQQSRVIKYQDDENEIKERFYADLEFGCRF